MKVLKRVRDGDQQHLKESTPLKGKSSWVPRVFHHLFPVGFFNNVKVQCALTGPVCLTEMSTYILPVISVIFCGHLGKIELDSVSLAVAVFNVTGLAVGTGLSTACDTLISQTYGSKNVKRVGTILQRAILILLLFCFPCWAVFINTESILLFFHQDPDIARLTQKYIVTCIPALPAAFLFQLEVRYLQNQGIIWPQVFTGVVVNIINAIINAVFLYVLNLGIVGSAVSNVISQITMVLLLFIYIRVRKLHVETWAGWSIDCLQEWGPFVHVAVPSMLMMCMKWWSFEIGIFLAGLVSVVELGAQSIIMQISVLFGLIPWGFAVASGIRIGNALGAGDIDLAILSWKVSISCSVFFSLISAMFFIGLKDHIAYLFTLDRKKYAGKKDYANFAVQQFWNTNSNDSYATRFAEISHLVSRVMMLYAVYQVPGSIATTFHGILRGCGKQIIGAILVAVGYYVVGLPIGITLMFAAKLGIVGLWSGIIICAFFEASSFFVFIYRMNWNKAHEEAQVRAGIKLVQNETLLSNVTKTTIQKEKGDVNTFDSNHYGANGDGTEGTIQQDTACGDKKHEPIIPETTNIVGEVLSVKQLIIRRGLTVALAVSILVTSILIKFLIVNQ